MPLRGHVGATLAVAFPMNALLFPIFFIKYNMRNLKNIKLFTIILLFLLVILTAPVTLQADEDEEKGPSIVETLTKPLLDIAPFYLQLLPWIAVAILIAATLKTWMLKRKLSIARKWQNMEKLFVGTLSETLAELFFLLIFMIFFTPAYLSIFKWLKWGVITGESGDPLKLIVMILLTLPYSIIIGAVLILVNLHLVTRKPAAELRPHMTLAALLAPIFPILLSLVILIKEVLLKASPDTGA